MARQRKDDVRARTYLELADRSSPPIPRPRVYLELARLRAAAIAEEQGGRPFTASQLVRVLEPLFVAKELRP